jgi:hypothetical protein
MRGTRSKRRCASSRTRPMRWRGWAWRRGGCAIRPPCSMPASGRTGCIASRATRDPPRAWRLRWPMITDCCAASSPWRAAGTCARIACSIRSRRRPSTAGCGCSKAISRCSRKRTRRAPNGSRRRVRRSGAPSAPSMCRCWVSRSRVWHSSIRAGSPPACHTSMKRSPPRPPARWPIRTRSAAASVI